MSTERLVRTFLDLVRIDSPSLSEASVATVLELDLVALGCTVRTDDTTHLTGSDTGNLIAELPGTVERTLVLSAHMDCVDPCRSVDPVERDGVLYSSGETVLGADDKAGVAAIVEALRRIAAEHAERPTIRCIFTVAEELGLKGAKVLDPAEAAGDLCLVLDADGRPGGIVVAAPTHYTFRADFRGTSAHAGVAPEKGVSAIVMAARAIGSMRLGRIDELTTANVGSISGGSATNVVTPQVTMTGECRSLDRDVVESLRLEMTRAMESAALEMQGEVDVVWTLEYEGFMHDESDPNLDLVRSAARDAGLEPHMFRTGGGSDANIMAAAGTPTFVLACGMSGVHSTEEFVRVADLESLTRFVVAIAQRMKSGV